MQNPKQTKPWQRTTGSKLLTYLVLHIILFLYSLAALCSKLAAGQEFLSLWFIVYYGLVLIILFVYAILWQQILKRLPLTTAFANKGVTMIWGFLWGALLFSEHISLFMIIGAAVIFVGIMLVITSDREKASNRETTS